MLDEETRVLRKQLFDFLFDLEVKKAIRYQYFVTVLFLELDWGDGEGAVETPPLPRNELLRVVAELLRDELRATDVIGRHPDDRFSILLHHADDANTVRVGERLRRRVADYVFAQGMDGRRTVSIGGACFPTNGNYADDLLSEAERMLQRAKDEGGNKVYVAPRE
jgi:predicted signal transduction protein with EAL and GGDEF domain